MVYHGNIVITTQYTSIGVIIQRTESDDITTIVMYCLLNACVDSLIYSPWS